MRDFIEDIEEDQADTVVVADMEAGLEHLTWAGGTLRHVDLLLVVVQPTVKARLTADRTLELARQLGISRVAFVGNRCVGPDDVVRMEEFAAARGCDLLAAIPEDPAIGAADRSSHCVLDAAPASAAVAAIQALAERLEADFLST